jgi:hypothetical protein
MSRFALITLLPLSLLFGCATSTTKADSHPSHPGPEHVVKPASDAQRAALIDRVKSLAGTWEMSAPDGTSTTIVFGVTAAGSAVREVMFPGTEHEMTNMYHMDGESLLVTHYCGSGNQPRMRATTATAAADRIDFKFDSMTNMTAADADAMASLSLVWVDADHIRQEWRSTKSGKHTEPAIFELHRRKE